jgi:hypothetical protein
MRKTFPFRTILLIALTLVLALPLASCKGKTEPASEHTFSMAAADTLPAEIRSAPAIVVQSYQFAAANPQVLQEIPCYCGCGAMGHTSNYACYISGEDAEGKLNYDAHALGCSICVDITQDAMRLLDQGKSASEIRAYVDETYARFGPSNMP